MLAAHAVGSGRAAPDRTEGFTLATASTLADTAAFLESAIARLCADLARLGQSERRIASELAAILWRLSLELRSLTQERQGASVVRRIEALRDVLAATIASRGGAVTPDGGLVFSPTAGAAERGELRRLEAELARIIAMLGALLARLGAAA